MRDFCCGRSLQNLHYYYIALEPKERTVFLRLADGILEHQSDIVTISLDRKSVLNVLLYLKMDIPELFSYKNCTYTEGPQSMTFHMEYHFDAETHFMLLQEMEYTAEEILGNMPHDLDEWEIERYIYEYLATNCTYDGLDQVYAHSALGPIIQQRAVCEGISKATKYLLDRAGVHSAVIFGGGDLGGRVNHAWNMVQLSGQWYHVDITYDLSEGRPRFQYFNLQDEKMKEDHMFTPLGKGFLRIHAR
ncbi:MAG: transglutaminase domain-containing protein [Oscillospiraceae bacterium]|jgi:hypothetical protein